MTDRQRLLLVLIALVMLILASCQPPAPRISSIQSNPEIAEKGGTTVYTIQYQNYNQESSFSDTSVVVEYDEYLIFDQNAAPFPDEIDERNRKLRWKVGTLNPGEGDSPQSHVILASSYIHVDMHVFVDSSQTNASLL